MKHWQLYLFNDLDVGDEDTYPSTYAPCAQAHIDIYLNIIFMNNLTHILWSIKHKSFTINFNINYISQFLFILLWHFSLSFLSLSCTSFCLYLSLPHPSNFTPFLSLSIYIWYYLLTNITLSDKRKFYLLLIIINNVYILLLNSIFMIMDYV